MEADGAGDATAPAAVTLTFSEAVSLSGDSVRVLDPAGEPVAGAELVNMPHEGPPTVVGKTCRSRQLWNPIGRSFGATWAKLSAMKAMGHWLEKNWAWRNASIRMIRLPGFIRRY